MAILKHQPMVTLQWLRCWFICGMWWRVSEMDSSLRPQLP